jgi:uncharacterized protein
VSTPPSAPPAPVEPWIASIPAFIESNDRAFQAAACFLANEIAYLKDASIRSFARVQEVLTQRGRQGYVRRCHGDLHLGNIVLIERKPVLFDAIEFDPTIASIDVLYDLAFTIMDFIRYDRHAAANALLNRYLKTTSSDNLDALAAMPLFMSLRAAIRANVLLARLERNTDCKADVVPSAQTYFDLARRLIDPAAPTLVAVGGLSGTGKSVLAHALAPSILPQPGTIVLRTDVLRKQQFGVHETDRLPEEAYQPEVTQKIYDLLAQHASRILSQGHSVVVDAVFARESKRTEIRDAARRLNIRFVGLFLQTDLATRLNRVGRRKGDASDATPEIAGLQEKYDIGTIDWAVIDASGTPEQTLRRSQIQIAHNKTAST